jgi:hypothetical protein
LAGRDFAVGCRMSGRLGSLGVPRCTVTHVPGLSSLYSREHLGLERAMEALVRTVLLWARRLGADRLDPEAKPPDAPLREPAQASRSSERCAVVAPDRPRKAELAEGPLEERLGSSALEAAQAVERQAHPARVIEHGQRVAPPAVLRRELLAAVRRAAAIGKAGTSLGFEAREPLVARLAADLGALTSLTDRIQARSPRPSRTGSALPWLTSLSRAWLLRGAETLNRRVTHVPVSNVTYVPGLYP